MKKVLSVLLSVVMMFSCIGVLVYAEGETPVEISNEDLSALVNYALPSGINAVVPAGKTLTVPADKNLIVSIGSTLLVEQGASLVIEGRVSVQENASLKIAGRVTNAPKIACDTQGEAVAEVRFPDLRDFALADKVYIKYAFGYTGGSTDDLTGLEWHDLPQTSALSVWAPLNQYLYINAHIIEPAEISSSDQLGKYDDSKFNVWINDVEMPYTQDQHSIKLLFAGDITYSIWDSDDTFIAERKISLRSGEGYTVYSRDGRTSANDGIVYIKYGQPFSFRVDIDDEYNMSAYSVYVVKGFTLLEFDPNAVLDDSLRVYPDKDGYYMIDPVEGDYTVFVLGVIKNETVEKVSNIFEMVKNVFEMIAKFFRQFLDIFKFD
ncbi:MAG: hypothetical protein IK104_07295 [Clostridia bacterium]|nr:hypothetical protein [Clostridia bacterium]